MAYIIRAIQARTYPKIDVILANVDVPNKIAAEELVLYFTHLL
jgi:hypothetical protein